MAIDPKQILQRNKSLVGLYGLALVPIPLWFVLVMNGIYGDNARGKGVTPSYSVVAAQLTAKTRQLTSLAGRIKTMNGQLESKQPVTDPVYVSRNKTVFDQRNEDLKTQLEAMKTLVAARDSVLEDWFPEFASYKGKTEMPPAADFDRALQGKLQQLQKDHGDFVVDPASPDKRSFLWQELCADKMQRTLQKKFWVQDRILSSLKRSGAERLLGNVEFPVVSPVVAGPNVPRPLVSPIPARVVFSASFRDIPRIVRELLAQDIVFRLTKLHTELTPFGFVRKEFDPPLKVNSEQPKILYDRTIYSATLAANANVGSDDEKLLPEPRVKVTLELEALDFEMDAIAAATNPPAAPEPAAVKEEPAPPPRKNKPKKDE